MAETTKQQILVDVDEFVRTRDALSTAYISLSASIDKAVKAYIEHTNVVLAGGNSLNISYLLQPFQSVSQVGTGQLPQHGMPGYLPPAGLGVPPATPGVVNGDLEVAADGKRKRNYKPRDPNAPKRPLTAYFRYLQQNRKAIADEFTGEEQRAPGEISKIATDRWHKMSDKEKQPYIDEYRRELEKHVKDMEVYKDNGGDITDLQLKKLRETGARAAQGLVADAALLEDEDGMVAKTGGGVPAVDSDASTDDSSSSESEDSEAEDPFREPTPPPPPPPTTTKKSGKRASKAAVSTPAPATQTFSSLDAPATRSSPDLKRKAAEPVELESGKKKRGRKTKAEKAAEETKAMVKDSSPVGETIEAGAKKRKETTKRKKKGGDA